MRAFWYQQAGAAAEVLQQGERDTPEPGIDEVRVRIAYSAINPTDVKRRTHGRELGKFPLIIPNNDGSGVIDAIGEGVDTARLGERVWIFGAQADRPSGTAADHCIVPSRFARHLPDNQSMQDGVCLGVPAVTAHRGCFADGPIDGKTVLLTGGTGRVGRYIVQMAQLGGATVIATAGSAEKADHVRKLGANHVINYVEDDLVEAVTEITNGAGVDRFIDVAFGVNIGNVPQLVKPNGVVTSYGSDEVGSPVMPFLQLMAANILVRPFIIYGMPDAAQDAAFEAVEAWLAEDKLDHLVGKRFTFDDMAAAHEAIERGDFFGCCIVEVDGGIA
jgi:NADPH:quinone reductase